jgi:hypothetical protein
VCIDVQVLAAMDPMCRHNTTVLCKPDDGAPATGIPFTHDTKLVDSVDCGMDVDEASDVDADSGTKTSRRHFSSDTMIATEPEGMHPISTHLKLR